MLVLSVPDELAAQGVSIRCFAIPILSRRGGLLLNLPRGVVSEDALIDSLHVEDDSGMLGPSKGVSAHLCVEDEEGNIVVRQDSVNSLVIDFSDEVLPLLREYGVVVAEEGDIVPFSVNAPTALPSHTEVCESAVAWIGQTGPERVNFYSAQEDPEEPAVEKAAAEVKSGATKKAPAVKRVTNAQVLDQLSTLVAQIQTLSARQDALESRPAKDASGPSPGNIANVPAVSRGPCTYASLCKICQVSGAPSKSSSCVFEGSSYGIDPRSASCSSCLRRRRLGLSHQSAVDCHVGSCLPDRRQQRSPYGSHKSRAIFHFYKREKMQSDLAMGASNYYMQMMQQLHKKLHPSRPIPKTEGETGHLSFLEYLEKTGGYKNARESGLLMWLLGHVIDALAVEDLHMAKERVALLAIALEQSVVDKGGWSVAFLLSLASEPPLQMFQEKSSVVSPFGQPFAGLVPPPWAATVLSYIKELEVLSNKKADQIVPKKKKNSESEEASPKKRGQPRFPKKPKAEPPSQVPS